MTSKWHQYLNGGEITGGMRRKAMCGIKYQWHGGSERGISGINKQAALRKIA